MGFWTIYVYYNITPDKFPIFRLRALGAPSKEISEIQNKITHNKAKAFTYNSEKYRSSVIGFNKHSTFPDYINSIVHEAEHVKEAILNYYNVENSGETAAETLGYIVSEMYYTYKKFIK